MARADATIQQMPAIIARLQSLRPLHEESLTFSQTLRHLHNQQSQIVHMLSSHNAHLIKVPTRPTEDLLLGPGALSSLFFFSAGGGRACREHGHHSEERRRP